MQKQRVEYLLDMLNVHVGQKGSNDISIYWFETLYKMIRSKKWEWNWTWTRFLTLDPITDGDYTYTQGTDYLQNTGTPGITYTNVGRYVVIGDSTYKVRWVDATANRVYLDAPIAEATITDAVELVFYRLDKCIKTSGVRSVFLDGYRLPSVDQHRFERIFRTRVTFSALKPCAYSPIQSYEIPAPTYEPSIAEVVGTVDAGTRYYFYTFYDAESGKESAPGPVTEHTTAGTKNFELTYNNPSATNKSEGPGYTMRLYRSQSNPFDTERFAAYLVASKDPFSATVITDSLSDRELKNNERYYDGNRVDVHFDHFPDAVYSVNVEHVNDYGCRPELEDRVAVGNDNIVQELMNLGVLQFVESINGNSVERDKVMIAFKRQLNYLVRNERKANDSDYSIDNTKDYTGPIPDEDGSFDIVDTWRYND